MTDEDKIAKILEELRFQRREMVDAQKDVLQHIGRIEVYVAGLSDQLSRTLEMLGQARTQPASADLLDS